MIAEVKVQFIPEEKMNFTEYYFFVFRKLKYCLITLERTFAPLSVDIIQIQKQRTSTKMHGSLNTFYCYLYNLFHTDHDDYVHQTRVQRDFSVKIDS